MRSRKNQTAQATYARVFKHFVYGLSLLLLLASLFARPILAIIAPPEYAGAADIVPIVCLAYLLFSLHDHFKVPALLASRTIALLPAVTMAAVANVALNFLLVPWLGAAGAAWASVATFALFAFVGLVRNRRIERYPYPFAACFVAVAGMSATYIGYRLLWSTTSGPLSIAAAVVVWLVWAVLLFGRSLRGQDWQRSFAVLRHSVFSGREPLAADATTASPPPDPHLGVVDGSTATGAIIDR